MMAAITKARPILFSSPMVRAILEGRKTQTRRVIKPHPPKYIDELHGNDLRGRAPYRLEDNETGLIVGSGFQDDGDVFYKCPYGASGDCLWVRETWGDRAAYASIATYRADRYYYAADGRVAGWKYRPSIHMPRAASRITLEITSIRVERLQEITEEDAKAEGVNETLVLPGDRGSFVQSFAMLWCDINGPESWSENPWVWVIEFARKDGE